MASAAVVEDRINAGQRLIEQFKDDGGSVRMAFWIADAEDDLWRLYLVTDAVNRDGFAASYRALRQSFEKLRDCRLDLFEVQLLSPKDTMARDAEALLKRQPGPLPASFDPQTLGGVEAATIYVYPRTIEKIRIYGSGYPGYPGGGPVSFSFSPIEPAGWLEVESGGETKRYREDTSLSWILAAPEGAKLEGDELVWSLYGRPTRSSAQEIWTLAKLGLHGFRFLDPPTRDPATAPNTKNEGG